MSGFYLTPKCTPIQQSSPLSAELFPFLSIHPNLIARVLTTCPQFNHKISSIFCSQGDFHVTP